jgi:hypothetical protein
MRRLVSVLSLLVVGAVAYAQMGTTGGTAGAIPLGTSRYESVVAVGGVPNGGTDQKFSVAGWLHALPNTKYTVMLVMEADNTGEKAEMVAFADFTTGPAGADGTGAVQVKFLNVTPPAAIYGWSYRLIGGSDTGFIWCERTDGY